MALGKNIRAFRTARGLSQEALSRLTGGVVSQGAISALEKRDSSASEFTQQIADALGVSMRELITGKQDSVNELTKIYNSLDDDMQKLMLEQMRAFVKLNKRGRD